MGEGGLEPAPQIKWQVLHAPLTAIWTQDGIQIWAVGEQGLILHSTDGGKSWIRQLSKPGSELKALTGSGRGDELQLFAIEGLSSVLRSRDGGRTWTEFYSSNIFDSNGMWSTGGGDKLQVWVAGRHGVQHSIDAGKTWLPIEGEDVTALAAIWGTEEEGKIELWAAGSSGVIQHSTDGGTIWTKQASGTQSNLTIIRGLGQGADRHLWAAGAGGVIQHSLDGGTTWAAQQSGTKADIVALWGIAEGVKVHLWAVGADGGIQHSSDAGTTWRPQNGVLRPVIHALTGANEAGGLQLWAVGDGGSILHSADAGESWQSQRSGIPGEMTALWGNVQEDKVCLWAVGKGGMVLHSEDGGETWSSQNSGTTNDLESLWGSGETEKLELWSVGHGGTILYSENGGATWKPQVSGTSNHLRALWGTSTNNRPDVWAVGDRGVILKGTEKGGTWMPLPSGTDRNLCAIFGIHEGDSLRLWTLGWNDEEGNVILSSPDGGRVWNSIFSREGSYPLQTIWGTGVGKNQRMWAGGKEGLMLYSEGGGTWSDQQDLPGYDTKVIWGTGKERGFQVWRGDYLQHSADGGQSWNGVGGAFSALWGSTKKSHLHLWAVGSRGTMLHGEQVDVYPNVTSAKFIKNGLETQLRVTITNKGNSRRDLEVYIEGLNKEFMRFEAWKSLAPVRKVTLKAGETQNLLFPVGPKNLAIRPGDLLAFQITMRTGWNSEDFHQVFTGALTYEGWKWLRDNLAWLIPLGTILLLCGFLYGLLFVAPLMLLRIHRTLRFYEAIDKIKLPFGLSDLLNLLLYVTILPFFVTHRRVLDAWVDKHKSAVQERFDRVRSVHGALLHKDTANGAERLVEAHSEDGTLGTENKPAALEGGTSIASPKLGHYVALPVSVEPAGELIERPSPLALSPFFAPACSIVQIVATAGGGKTRLALEIGQWAVLGGAGGIASHVMLPIFVDEDTTDLSAVIHRKLRSWLREDTEDNLMHALLKSKRLLVIVDRLSERHADTQEHICGIHGSYPVNALVVTTRRPTSFESEEAVTLMPMPLDADNMLYFMTSLLRGLPGAAFGGMRAQLKLGEKLAGLLPQEHDTSAQITPLLVKLFVEEAVRLAKDNVADPLAKLPSSIPEIYFDYLRALNPHGPDKDGKEMVDEIEDQLMLKAARLFASIALGDDFVPKEFDGDEAVQFMERMGSTAEEASLAIRRLTANGVLLLRDLGGVTRYRYLLDPICELLGAYHRALEAGRDVSSWNLLLASVRSKGELAAGFREALRLIWLRYHEDFAWPEQIRMDS